MCCGLESQQWANGLDNAVQMLQWNVKFWAQCEVILCLTYHSITDYAQFNKNGEMLTKGFWISDDWLSIDNIVYTKRRVFECFVFDKVGEKLL